MYKTALFAMFALLAVAAFAAPAPISNDSYTPPVPNTDDRWLQYCGAYGTYWYGDFRGQGMGVKLTPYCYPVRIDTASLYFQNTAGSYRWRLRIYDDDGTGGTPGTVLFDSLVPATVRYWHNVYVGGHNLQVTSGSFFIFMYYDTLIGGQPPPWIGLDNNGRSSPNPNWYDPCTNYVRNHFQPYTLSNHDIMIRAWLYDAGSPASDVGLKWLSPVSGTFDSTSGVATPACTVFNRGTATVTFPVRLRIGSGYNNTVSVASLAAGTRRYVTFPAFANRPRGTHAVTCTTELGGDSRNGNDTLKGSIDIRVVEAQAVRVMAPRGVIDSGASVAPQCSVRNNGTLTNISTRMY